jgi:predicted transcriptional regulator
MLTDRDISMAAFMQWKHLSEANVESAMSRSLCACSPDDELARAEDVMRQNQVRRLPVVDANGVLVGLLSLSDVARYVRQHSPRGDNQAQQHIADRMPVPVVDVLEAVEIDEHQDGGRGVTPRISDSAPQFALEGAAVEHVEQRINVGMRLELDNALLRRRQFAAQPIDLRLQGGHRVSLPPFLAFHS